MTRRRRSRRESIAFRLPVAVLEYPFECFTAIGALIMGVALVLGLTRPGSVAALLPAAGVTVWGASLILGGSTILIGLAGRRIPAVMAAGLRLVSVLFLIYAVSIVYILGFRQAGLSAALFTLIGGLAAFRAFYLRTLAAVEQRIHKEG